jgi:hypothetical protein
MIMMMMMMMMMIQGSSSTLIHMSFSGFVYKMISFQSAT